MTAEAVPQVFSLPDWIDWTRRPVAASNDVDSHQGTLFSSPIEMMRTDGLTSLSLLTVNAAPFSEIGAFPS